MKKRLLALALVIALLCSLLPATVLAESDASCATRLAMPNAAALPNVAVDYSLTLTAADANAAYQPLAGKTVKLSVVAPQLYGAAAAPSGDNGAAQLAPIYTAEAVSDKDGVCSFSIPGQKSGLYTLTGSFEGDDENQPCAMNALLYVGDDANDPQPRLYVTTQELSAYLGDEIMTGLVFKGSEPVVGAVAELTVEGIDNNYKNAFELRADESGGLVLRERLSAGKYAATLRYTPTEGAPLQEATFTLSVVSKVSTELVGEDLSTAFAENYEWKLRLTNKVTGAPISDEMVSLEGRSGENSFTLYAPTDADGYITMGELLIAGVYDVLAKYDGSIDNEGCELALTLTVRENQPVITVAADEIRLPAITDHLTATLTDEFGAPLAGQTLTVSFFSKSYLYWTFCDVITDDKGMISLPLNYKSDGFACILEYAGTETMYAPARRECTVVSEHDYDVLLSGTTPAVSLWSSLSDFTGNTLGVSPYNPSGTAFDEELARVTANGNNALLFSGALETDAQFFTDYIEAGIDVSGMDAKYLDAEKYQLMAFTENPPPANITLLEGSGDFTAKAGEEITYSVVCTDSDTQQPIADTKLKLLVMNDDYIQLFDYAAPTDSEGRASVHFTMEDAGVYSLVTYFNDYSCWTDDVTLTVTADGNAAQAVQPPAPYRFAAVPTVENGEAFVAFTQPGKLCLVAMARENPAKAIEITGESVVSLEGSAQLTAIVEPEFADDTVVSWSVSDASVATIDENGLLSGISLGTVTVTAKLTANPAIYAEKTIEVKLPMADGWQKRGAAWYYGADGFAVTGAQQLSGYRRGAAELGINDYFFSEQTARLCTGFKKTATGGNWNYYGEAGSSPLSSTLGQMIKSWYVKNPADGYRAKTEAGIDYYYYFDAEGTMLTGWQRIASQWRYFGEKDNALDPTDKNYDPRTSRLGRRYTNGLLPCFGYTDANGNRLHEYKFSRTGGMMKGEITFTIGGEKWLYTFCAEGDSPLESALGSCVGKIKL